MKKLAIATLLAVAAAGAIAQNPHGLPPGIAKKLDACDNCGHVSSVYKEKRKGEGGAVGIVGGAVVGGLLGNQIGKGTGKTVATVAGAAAGGYAGNEVQKHYTSKEVWVTKVQMKDGSTRSFEQEAQPAWKSGSIVRVNGKSLAAI
ncbi:glycine zipper 2TM domain-containing protein [Ramlibacter sp. USB13]|uniref:Glycine zipper 2TM domain-containing protein n=1 Tax=Ramlibacter cellulosilyticus TaxID=2764187 RepID=A0A923SA89_9BURK|nr:glycine zipper 2TM domain-containing protein [Ramlibacter cellulosilyticus]MBC5782514.1 glycine zipper 2TM domain-containing protein [Ramlibacter cellulosilyticus]